MFGIWWKEVTNNEQSKLRRLEKQFEELRMDERESIDSYFDRVKDMAEEFRRLKNEKSEYHVIKKVLASLSRSYQGVARLLEELMDVHNMTFKSLVEFFYGYEYVTEEDLERILKQRRLKSKSEKWCDVCNMNNHSQEECHLEAPEEEIVADYLLVAETAMDDITYDEDMWIIYGKATNHMTPCEKYFNTLDRTHKANVGLVDGTVIMVEGRGSIKIMMKEGKKKTINNVLFVPGLKRNVLSLSQMNSRGCSFTEGGRGECIIRDRTGKEFGETKWVDKDLALRLQVIESNLTS